VNQHEPHTNIVPNAIFFITFSDIQMQDEKLPVRTKSIQYDNSSSTYPIVNAKYINSNGIQFSIEGKNEK
jgi:hypothetical protein